MIGRPPSKASWLGLVVLLTAVLGFVFAVASSAQRTVRMHAALGIAVEAERPGGPTWHEGADGTDGDDDGADEDEAFPPNDPPDPDALPIWDNGHALRPRVAERRPKAPLLALEEDPP